MEPQDGIADDAPTPIILQTASSDGGVLDFPAAVFVLPLRSPRKLSVISAVRKLLNAEAQRRAAEEGRRVRRDSDVVYFFLSYEIRTLLPEVMS
jgi:hypothetical protein